jgi:hypothetical protein
MNVRIRCGCQGAADDEDDDLVCMTREEAMAAAAATAAATTTASVLGKRALPTDVHVSVVEEEAGEHEDAKRRKSSAHA